MDKEIEIERARYSTRVGNLYQEQENNEIRISELHAVVIFGGPNSYGEYHLKCSPELELELKRRNEVIADDIRGIEFEYFSFMKRRIGSIFFKLKYCLGWLMLQDSQIIKKFGGVDNRWRMKSLGGYGFCYSNNDVRTMRSAIRRLHELMLKDFDKRRDGVVMKDFDKQRDGVVMKILRQLIERCLNGNRNFFFDDLWLLSDGEANGEANLEVPSWTQVVKAAEAVVNIILELDTMYKQGDQGDLTAAGSVAPSSVERSGRHSELLLK